VFRLFSCLGFSHSFLSGLVSSCFNSKVFVFVLVCFFFIFYFIIFFFEVFRWVEGLPVADAPGRPAQFS
jgi:hypothetical protein